MEKEQLQAEFPELFEAVLEEGKAAVTWEEIETAFGDKLDALKLESAAAERTRVMEILEAGASGELTLEAVRSGQSPAEALKTFWAKRDEQKSRALDNLAAAAAPSVGQVEIEKIEQPIGASIEKQALAEWDKDASLAAEFKTFETYLAFRRAESRGQIKQ